MADIHLLESSFSKKNGCGTIRVVFHVPNDTGQNNYPGEEISIVPGILQAEIDALTAGTLIEVIEDIPFNVGLAKLSINGKIRTMWQPIATKTQNKLNKNYKFYGLSLARSA